MAGNHIKLSLGPQFFHGELDPTGGVHIEKWSSEHRQAPVRPWCHCCRTHIGAWLPHLTEHYGGPWGPVDWKVTSSHLSKPVAVELARQSAGQHAIRQSNSRCFLLADTWVGRPIIRSFRYFSFSLLFSFFLASNLLYILFSIFTLTQQVSHLVFEKIAFSTSLSHKRK